MTTLSEKQPHARADWQPAPCPAVVMGNRRTVAASAWQRVGVLVLSSLECGAPTDGTGGALYWHVSITERGARASRAAVRRVLADFGMMGAPEVTRAGSFIRQFARVAVASSTEGRHA